MSSNWKRTGIEPVFDSNLGAGEAVVIRSSFQRDGEIVSLFHEESGKLICASVFTDGLNFVYHHLRAESFGAYRESNPLAVFANMGTCGRVEVSIFHKKRLRKLISSLAEHLSVTDLKRLLVLADSVRCSVERAKYEEVAGKVLENERKKTKRAIVLESSEPRSAILIDVEEESSPDYYGVKVTVGGPKKALPVEEPKLEEVRDIGDQPAHNPSFALGAIVLSVFAGALATAAFGNLLASLGAIVGSLFLFVIVRDFVHVRKN
ncbi:MAG: hypothetical protein NUW37_17335 [Planctomycetes bacterium]|nr:hypothetical protein [Planctomycetota bacterium]